MEAQPSKSSGRGSDDDELPFERSGARRPLGAEWEDSAAPRMPVIALSGEVQSVLALRDEEAAEERKRLARPYALEQMRRIAEEAAKDDSGEPSAKRSKQSGGGHAAGDGLDVGGEMFDEELEAAPAGSTEVLRGMRKKRSREEASHRSSERLEEALGRGSFTAWLKIPLGERTVRRSRGLERIAELCEQILEAPEKRIVVNGQKDDEDADEVEENDVEVDQSGKKQVDCLTELHAFCSEGDPVLRRAAMLSELSVFKDIVPGYRIKVETEDEASGVRLSKDVKRLRRFEAALLGSYKRYLVFLEATVRAIPRRGRTAPGGEEEVDAEQVAEQLKALPWHSRKAAERRILKQAQSGLTGLTGADEETTRMLGLAALKCQCSLLTELCHFNFARNLIAATLPRAARHYDEEVEELCTDAIKQLFQHDTSPGYEATLEGVRAMARYVRTRGTNVRPRLVMTLLSLPIREALIEADRRERRDREAAASSKGKRRKKDEVAAALALADADDRDKRVQGQVEMLTSVFHVCFRILKSSRNAALLPAVLACLGKYSHLVDLHLAADLVLALRHLAASTSVISYAEVEGMRDMGGREGGVAAAMADSAHAEETLRLQRELEARYASERGTLSGPVAGGGMHVTQLPQATSFSSQAHSSSSKALRDSTANAELSRTERRTRLAALGVVCAPHLSLKIPAPTALAVALTGLRVLSGPGKQLNMDSSDFVSLVYRALLVLCDPLLGTATTPSVLGDVHSLVKRKRNETVMRTLKDDVTGTAIAVTTRLALDAVTACLLRRQEDDLDRVAAMFNRLLVAAQHVPPPSAVALINLARQVFARYPALKSLFEPPADRVVTGVHLIDGGSLGAAAGLSATVWQLGATLRSHWHPSVVSAATALCQGRPPAPAEYPHVMLEALELSSVEGVTVLPKPPGPLGLMVRSAESLAKARDAVTSAPEDEESDEDDEWDASLPLWAFGDSDTIELEREKWAADPQSLRAAQVASMAYGRRTIVDDDEDVVWAVADGHPSRGVVEEWYHPSTEPSCVTLRPPKRCLPRIVADPIASHGFMRGCVAADADDADWVDAVEASMGIHGATDSSPPAEYDHVESPAADRDDEADEADDRSVSSPAAVDSRARLDWDGSSRVATFAATQDNAASDDEDEDMDDDAMPARVSHGGRGRGGRGRGGFSSSRGGRDGDRRSGSASSRGGRDGDRRSGSASSRGGRDGDRRSGSFSSRGGRDGDRRSGSASSRGGRDGDRRSGSASSRGGRDGDRRSGSFSSRGGRDGDRRSGSASSRGGRDGDRRSGSFSSRGGRDGDRRSGSFSSRGGRDGDRRSGSFSSRGGRDGDRRSGSFSSRGGRDGDRRSGSFSSRGGRDGDRRSGSFSSRGGRDGDRRSGSFSSRGGRDGDRRSGSFSSREGRGRPSGFR
jgi:hypothetical protein